MATQKYVSVSNFKGLVTAAGQLGAPPGGFSQADNVDIPNTTLLEKRHGMRHSFANFNGQGVAAAMYFSQPMGSGLGHLLVNKAANSAATAPSALYDATAGAALTPPGALSPANDITTRMKCAVMRGNTYCTTTNGVARIESDGGAWWAGAPTISTISNPPPLVSGAGWLAVGSTVAYRALLVQYDADGVPMRGPPSGAWSYKNTTGGPVNVNFSYITSLGAYAVNGVTPGISAARIDASNSRRIDVEVYRTTASAIGTPGDEMQLCHRHTLTAAEKTGAIAGFVDQCPDEALGPYLYTNAVSGGDTIVGGLSVGLAGRNDAPPIATDLAVFSNRMWYSGLTVSQELVVSVIAPGTTGASLKTGDVLTIDGVALTITAYTVGSVVENITETAKFLVYNIVTNVLPTRGISAEYVGNTSSPGTAGMVRIFATQPSRASFTVQLTSGGSGSAFVPDLTSAVSSTRESWRNGLAYSKESQADAVPPVNYVRVGRGDVAIQRIVTLRDALYIFASDGIWRLTGTSPATFSLDRFDTSFRLAARDSVAVLDDAIYAWGHEGIARITSSGVTLIDDAIRDLVTQQYIAPAGGVAYNWSVVDRVRKRVLFFIANHSNSACNLNSGVGANFHRALVYQVRSAAWTRYDYSVASTKTCGCELGPGAMGANAYAPPFVLANADSGGGTPTGALTPPAGETDGYGYTAGSTSTGFLVTESFSSLPTGTDWYDDTNAGGTQGIQCILEWTCATPDPMAVAQWTDAVLLLSPSDTTAARGKPTSVVFYFSTEMASYGSSFTAVVNLPRQVRVMIPRDSGRGSHMVTRVVHGVSSENLSIDGYALRYILDSEAVSR